MHSFQKISLFTYLIFTHLIFTQDAPLTYNGDFQGGPVVNIKGYYTKRRKDGENNILRMSEVNE